MPSLLYVATVSHTIRHFLVPYAEHLRALGWRVDAAGSGGTEDPALRGAFDNVYDLPLSRSIRDVGGMVRGERAIARLLAATRPDIVHVHTPIAAALTRVAARRMPAADRPLVAYTAHGFHFYRGGSRVTNALFRTIEQIAGRWTDRLVVINEEDAAAARRHRLVPPERLVRMPGIGVDTTRYARAAIPAGDLAGIRATLGLNATDPYFALVGELNRNKRSSDIVAALAGMRHADARLVLLGEGPERPRLEQLVQELGIADRVRFSGFMDDIRPVVAQAAALILASSREGLARSIMEALALEVPVIGSTARGNAELVGAGSGFVVPTGDIAGFTERMDWLIDHPDEAAAMGRIGRQRMVTEYDLRELIHRHEAMYLDMLAGRGRDGRTQPG